MHLEKYFLEIRKKNDSRICSQAGDTGAAHAAIVAYKYTLLEAGESYAVVDLAFGVASSLTCTARPRRPAFMEWIERGRPAGHQVSSAAVVNQWVIAGRDP